MIPVRLTTGTPNWGLVCPCSDVVVHSEHVLGGFHGISCQDYCPHDRDVPLKAIIDLLLKIQGNALSIGAANPRHEHEWNVFEEVQQPEGKILVPGVIDSCSNYIEHPEVVAQRLVRFARVVARENIIAGTDCGFDTFVGASAIAPSVAWAKL